MTGQQRLFQATTATGQEGASSEALYTAMYWAQVSPHRPYTPESTVALMMQAKAMRNSHLHHPFNHSSPAQPWPTDPLETVKKLADLTPSGAKVTIRAPAEPPLQQPDQQATHPSF